MWKPRRRLTRAVRRRSTGCTRQLSAASGSRRSRPRYVVDREPRRGGHGGGRDSSDRLDLAVQVRLVGVAALGGNARGGVTRREQVSGVVEAHQLRGAFGCEADLGPEAGPQALAAPADLLGQAMDPYPPPAGDRPPPGVDDLRVDRG